MSQNITYALSRPRDIAILPSQACFVWLSLFVSLLFCHLALSLFPEAGYSFNGVLQRNARLKKCPPPRHRVTEHTMYVYVTRAGEGGRFALAPVAIATSIIKSGLIY